MTMDLSHRTVLPLVEKTAAEHSVGSRSLKIFESEFLKFSWKPWSTTKIFKHVFRVFAWHRVDPFSLTFEFHLSANPKQIGETAKLR